MVPSFVHHQQQIEHTLTRVFMQGLAFLHLVGQIAYACACPVAACLNTTVLFPGRLAFIYTKSRARISRMHFKGKGNQQYPKKQGSLHSLIIRLSLTKIIYGLVHTLKLHLCLFCSKLRFFYPSPHRMIISDQIKLHQTIRHQNLVILAVQNGNILMLKTIRQSICLIEMPSTILKQQGVMPFFY